MVDQEPFGSFYLNAHTSTTLQSLTELPSDDILQDEDSLPPCSRPGPQLKPLRAAPAARRSRSRSSANLASLVATGDDPAVAA